MKLREIRAQRGLSGYKVAEILRISPQYYKEITRILVDGKIPIWEVDGEYFNGRSEAYEYVKSQPKTK